VRTQDKHGTVHENDGDKIVSADNKKSEIMLELKYTGDYYSEFDALLKHKFQKPARPSSGSGDKTDLWDAQRRICPVCTDAVKCAHFPRCQWEEEMEEGTAAAHRRCRTMLTDEYIRDGTRRGNLVSALPPTASAGNSFAVWEPCWWKQRLRARGLLKADLSKSAPSTARAGEWGGRDRDGDDVSSQRLSAATPRGNAPHMQRTVSLPKGDASFGINISMKVKAAAPDSPLSTVSTLPPTPLLSGRGSTAVTGQRGGGAQDSEERFPRASVERPSDVVKSKWRAQVTQGFGREGDRDGEKDSEGSALLHTFSTAPHSPSHSCSHEHSRPKTEGERAARHRTAREMWGGGGGGGSAKLPPGTPRLCYTPFYTEEAAAEEAAGGRSGKVINRLKRSLVPPPVSPAVT